MEAVTRIYDRGAPFLGEGCYFHPNNLTKTHYKPLSEVVEILRRREASFISAGFITKASYAKQGGLNQDAMAQDDYNVDVQSQDGDSVIGLDPDDVAIIENTENDDSKVVTKSPPKLPRPTTPVLPKPQFIHYT